MNYPLISEYVEAIKASEDNFEQLKNLRPLLDKNGESVFSSGGFAVVFKMKIIIGIIGNLRNKTYLCRQYE